MNRKFLSAWYETPRGQLLQRAEADFLSRSITVGCKQIILQIGALGWENRFIDCTLYRHFMIVDSSGNGAHEAGRVNARAADLPLMNDCADMIIVPHLLEFAADQHAVLREMVRVLKPEGKLIILSFNPWSWYVRYHYCKHREKQDSKLGRFIGRAKIVDWLKLLNFEVEIAAGFNFKAMQPQSPCSEKNRNSPWVAAYAVKAIKRRYNMIPLSPLSVKASRLAIAGVLETPNPLRKS
ncbi:MAG: class I SAM-dependent methyltransferase [Gammaproteobacteria bacterium]